jgi:quercetin dioxygenase-like cupin family protein
MNNNFILDTDIEWQDLGGGTKRKILAHGAGLMLTKVSFENGGIGTLHHHIHTQIAYVESGVFEFEIGGEKRIMRKGDVCYFEPNIVHGVKCIEAGILIDAFTPIREEFL